MVIVSRAHPAQAVFDEVGLTRRAARVLVGSLFEELAPRLVAGEKVRVYGFVQFPIRESRGIIRELHEPLMHVAPVVGVCRQMLAPAGFPRRLTLSMLIEPEPSA